MDKFFNSFLGLKGFGPTIASRSVPEATFARYRGKLPDKLLEYWREYGWCGFGDGLLWLVDPEEYQPAVDAWLEGTPWQGQDEYYLIARSALGRMYLWGRDSGPSIEIIAPEAQVFPDMGKRQEMAEDGADLTIQLFFATLSKDAVDLTDENEKPLFQRALRRLGPLAPDEMYGFVPALALGGRLDLANLRKVKALEHLVMLADLGERRIMADIVQMAKDQGLL